MSCRRCRLLWNYPPRWTGSSLQRTRREWCASATWEWIKYIHSLRFPLTLSASLHSLYSRTWYQRRNPRFQWVYWRRRGGRARIRRLCWRSIARLPLRPRVPVPICIRSRRPGWGHRQWKESGQVGSIGNSRRHFKREGSPSRIEVIN